MFIKRSKITMMSGVCAFLLILGSSLGYAKPRDVLNQAVAPNRQVLRVDDEVTSEESIPSDKKMKKAIPHCYVSSKHNVLKNIHRCLEEIKKFKAFLEKKFDGIVFSTDGSVFINGFRHWPGYHLNNKLGELAEILLGIEVQTLQNQATTEINDGLIAHGTSQEWTDAFASSHVPGGQYYVHTNQGVGFYMPGTPPENYGAICGLDVECWKRDRTLNHLTNDTILSLPKGKCYHVTGKVTLENGQPKIEYQEVPASSCDHLLDYLKPR